VNGYNAETAVTGNDVTRTRSSATDGITRSAISNGHPVKNVGCGTGPAGLQADGIPLHQIATTPGQEDSETLISRNDVTRAASSSANGVIRRFCVCDHYSVEVTVQVLFLTR
jgi:hypothetical protein